LICELCDRSRIRSKFSCGDLVIVPTSPLYVDANRLVIHYLKYVGISIGAGSSHALSLLAEQVAVVTIRKVGTAPNIARKIPRFIPTISKQPDQTDITGPLRRFASTSSSLSNRFGPHRPCEMFWTSKEVCLPPMRFGRSLKIRAAIGRTNWSERFTNKRNCIKIKPTSQKLSHASSVARKQIKG